MICQDMVVGLCHEYALRLMRALAEFTVASHRWPHFFLGFSAFVASSCTHQSCLCLHVQAFPIFFFGTMPSADFCKLQLCFVVCRALPTQSACLQISSGNCTVFHLIYLPYLLSMTFGNRDFVLYGRLIRSSLASLRVRVPQVETLPTASFRFHLAMDTLAFG